VNLVRLLKPIGGPGSLGLLALGSAVGLFLIYAWPRNRRLGVAWFLGLYSSYLVMGLPVLAHRVAAPLVAPTAGYQPITGPLDTLAILDGDNRMGRIREGRRLWVAAKPATVIVSGEEWFVDSLLASGIPRQRLTLDHSSTTTREQIEYLIGYAAQHPAAHLAVVASRLQMPRILALARRTGLQATFYSSQVDREPATDGLWLLVPTYAGLRVTRDALYERAAITYYRRQGWIAADDPVLAAGVW
jgi:uncharacterized SAM-binding protein YcdF (DUF218 family)